jgi:lipopolysaccharide/colanic/teichoic acid biosynthesis glycosyltransferase
MTASGARARRLARQALRNSGGARRGYPASKRAFDLVLAVAMSIGVAPIVLFAMALVRLTSPGPVLFCQTRIGLNERPFTLLKLRTMHAESGDDAQRDFNTRELRGETVCDAREGIYKLERDPRVTRVGHVLRRFSIDELPQIINVLRGEMSLVGPRPSLPWEIELYTPKQRRRHTCPPGISGLWQVSGRNRMSMLEMLALDLEYVDSRTLLGDLQILLRTPRAVLFNRDTR